MIISAHNQELNLMSSTLKQIENVSQMHQNSMDNTHKKLEQYIQSLESQINYYSQREKNLLNQIADQKNLFEEEKKNIISHQNSLLQNDNKSELSEAKRKISHYRKVKKNFF